MGLTRLSLRTSISPLRIRTSISRLRICPHRRALSRMLLWPFPWYLKHASSPDIVDSGPDEKLIARIQPGIRQLHCIPLFRSRDTSLSSIYRMVEDLCAGHSLMLGYECEYMWYHAEERWNLSKVPDPEESDPVLYALLASMVESLVRAFNYKLALGLRRNGDKYLEDDRHIDFPRETVPAWAEHVKPIDKTLDLLSDEQRSMSGAADTNFSKRNILANTGDLYNV
ncbi:hypothetical protein AUEXF2481DRAFT_29622 [Aureobasidium subglaciale EXF-2481]|uniref:Uncharacterized protein n=1 Tax=Aureobasidium subglaciale (strain EXF-2481) TaxID=1043005 RepID=A0A074Z7L3_AURSE|nr:uncharacterized protein AUEXF2481DRAFT_29622 [Aureobasidium subglaciale EXF-2481]KEQ94881.1 hypothetical protein AUEXF2481DRAFT_29622 [Aureobasidium subglaciale EXF-2481]